MERDRAGNEEVMVAERAGRAREAGVRAGKGKSEGWRGKG